MQRKKLFVRWWLGRRDWNNAVARTEAMTTPAMRLGVRRTYHVMRHLWLGSC